MPNFLMTHLKVKEIQKNNYFSRTDFWGKIYILPFVHCPLNTSTEITLTIGRGCLIIIWTWLNIKIDIPSSKSIWVTKMILQSGDQFDHSYIFWTVPILIFSPVQKIMGHSLLILAIKTFPSKYQEKLWFSEDCITEFFGNVLLLGTIHLRRQQIFTNFWPLPP